jgi:hypothetical protein
MCLRYTLLGVACVLVQLHAHALLVILMRKTLHLIPAEQPHIVSAHVRRARQRPEVAQLCYNRGCRPLGVSAA